jgi:hypothetical protein
MCTNAEGEQKAADRRSGDGGDLRGRRRRGDRARKQRAGHDVGQQRLLSRCIEGAADPEHDDGAENERLARQAGDGADCERRGGEPLDGLEDLQQAATVVAVGDLARDQHESGRRQELSEPDQPQVEGAAGECVHLPGDRDAQHLEAERRAGSRRPVEREAPVAQDRHRRGIGWVHGEGLRKARLR